MRRRFLRRMGMPMRGRPGDAIPPLLIRSNTLLAAGRFAEAADGLEELALTAASRGGRRTAQLFLEAGRARILAGETSAGMLLLDRGLTLMASAGARLHLARAGRRILTELTARGLDGEAQRIRSSLADLGVASLEATPESGPSPSGRRPLLPVFCPGCGAPVHPDEVEWLDDLTAECEYCGSPMRPE